MEEEWVPTTPDEPEDGDIDDDGAVPAHDVLVSNPPYIPEVTPLPERVGMPVLVLGATSVQPCARRWLRSHPSPLPAPSPGRSLA